MSNRFFLLGCILRRLPSGSSFGERWAARFGRAADMPIRGVSIRELDKLQALRRLLSVRDGRMDEIQPDSAGVFELGHLHGNSRTKPAESAQSSKPRDRKARAGSNEQKIGDFYASCMDTAAIDVAGTKLSNRSGANRGNQSVADLQQ